MESLLGSNRVLGGNGGIFNVFAEQSWSMGRVTLNARQNDTPDVAKLGGLVAQEAPVMGGMAAL